MVGAPLHARNPPARTSTNRIVIDTLPAHSMGQPIGRNEPCPCGSGKKFKKCCGADAEGVGQVNTAPRGEPVSGWARAHSIWPKTCEALGKHALSWLGERRFAESLEDSWLFDPEKGLEPEWMPLYQSWQFYDWVAEDEEQTIAQHFLARHSVLNPGSDTDVRRMIESANASPLSFYQVQAIDRGRGAVLRDLLTHEERFVVDRSLSESVPPWSVLMARLISLESFTMFDAVAPRILSPDWAESLVEWIEENLEQTVPLSPEFLRTYGDDVVECYSSAVAEDDEDRKQLPIMHNTDDELLILCEERWRFAEGRRSNVIERLVELGFTHESDETEDPTVLRWVREEKGHTLPSTTLAILRVGPFDLCLETNSRERRDRFKAQIENAFAEELTRAGSQERTQDEIRDESPASDAPVAAVPPEIADQVIRQHLSQHYSTWPDYPLPALSGKSPRDAMKTAEGRASVEALIRDMEHQSHGTPIENKYDFDELRQSVGLPAVRGPLG